MKKNKRSHTRHSQLFLVNKNKRGVSAVVATVLMILITIAIAAVVSVTVVPMVRNNLQSGQICYNAVSQLEIANEGYTCYNASASNVSVQIHRLAKDFDLAGAQVLVSTGGNTKTFRVDTTNLGPNERATYEVGPVTGTPEQVQIAPIVSVGNSEKTCDVSATLALKDC